MKNNFIFSLLFGAFLIGCSEDNSQDLIQLNGHFSGYFEYQGTTYWSSLSFEEDRYTEWPSGGIYYQKSLECLTVGTYLLNRDKLSFQLDSFKFSDHPDPCENDMLLPGEYTVTYLTEPDSIVFEKGTGVNRIVYYLEK